MLRGWLKHYDLLIFDRIDSTNNEAIRLLKAGVKGNFVIISRLQTQGKGRKKKFWQSISGNMHASILLSPELPLGRLTELSFLTAVAVHDAIIECTCDCKAPSNDVTLKWPNDVLINGKKIAGILLESMKVDNRNYVIIGMGVNTHFMPNLADRETTSLLNEGIILKNSDSFLSKVMDKFHYYYSKWQKGESFAIIRNEWMSHAYRLGERVSFNDGRQVISGIFRGISQSGAIEIELQHSGQIVSFENGQNLRYE